MRELRFTLAKPYPLQNRTMRTHYRGRKKHDAAMAWEIRAALHGALPAEPFQRARVRIDRYSSGTPDYDGLVGGAKGLIDVLCCPGPRNAKGHARHPLGLSIIVDDDPAHLEREYHAMLCPRSQARTEVAITELPA